mgnify:CR=1 FL=1
MCIRDRSIIEANTSPEATTRWKAVLQEVIITVPVIVNILSCLLYTSDAADERSSVDLGGRRIIKKKKNIIYRVSRTA